MRIGLTHLDTFSAIGAFSGAGKVDPKTAYGGVFAAPVAFLLTNLPRRTTVMVSRLTGDTPLDGTRMARHPW
jgi:hypothetical protein